MFALNPYAAAPAGALAPPLTDHLLPFGDWYAQAGGDASAYEHLSQYLYEFGELPFGKLLADELLPAPLHGHSVSRAVVADLLHCLGTFRWVEIRVSAANTPPAGSPRPDACLAYFNQTLTVVSSSRADKVFTSELTPEALLRGLSLALPQWPVTLQPDAGNPTDRMLSLVTGGLLNENISPEDEELGARPLLQVWCLDVLAYALDVEL